jgi:hypothetical protein
MTKLVEEDKDTAETAHCKRMYCNYPPDTVLQLNIGWTKQKQRFKQ